MPRGDGTGPMGTGAIGRGLGWCGGSVATGRGQGVGAGWAGGFGRARRMAGGFGRGWSYGFGAGRGGGWRAGAAPAAVDPDTEKRALEQQAAALDAELQRLRRRVAELAAEKQPPTTP